jgi:hypothetical protein
VTGILKDLSTGVVDRGTDQTVREPDQWTIKSDSDLLAIIRDLAGQSPRVMVLQTQRCHVSFGLGYDVSYACVCRDGVNQSQRFPPFAHPVSGEFWSDIRLGFSMWGDDVVECWAEELMPLRFALEVVFWVFHNDTIPEREDLELGG